MSEPRYPSSCVERFLRYVTIDTQSSETSQTYPSTLKQLDRGLDQAINFGWTDIIAKPLLYILRFFDKYIHNYGVSIILLTVLVKILFWPLTHKSYKSMKEMQKLQPRMAKLREKYKNDKQKLRSGKLLKKNKNDRLKKANFLNLRRPRD